jgi:hypothetical protein
MLGLDLTDDGGVGEVAGINLSVVGREIAGGLACLHFKSAPSSVGKVSLKIGVRGGRLVT